MVEKQKVLDVLDDIGCACCDTDDHKHTDKNHNHNHNHNHDHDHNGMMIEDVINPLDDIGCG
jgi:ABC-type Zn2+ transport system substrate-binding protein/surface adhesin